MKAVVAAFKQEKALEGAFSVITNLRMELLQALFGTVLRGEASDKNRKLEIDGTILTLKIYRIINWWKMRNLMDSATIIPCHQHIIEVSMSVSFNVWSWRVDQIPFTQSKAVLIKKIWRKHADIELRLGLKNLQLRKREYGKVAKLHLCPCRSSATGQDDSYSWGQGRASWCQSGSPLEHTTLTNEQPQLKWCQQLFSSFVSVWAASGFAVLCVAANTNANCQLEVGN